MFRPDPDSSTPIAVVSALTVFACMVLKFASTAYFLLSKNPSDIESTSLRRSLFVVSKVTPPLLVWSLCLWVWNMFWNSAPIVVLLLAFLATGVTIFAWKVYKIRRAGRVLVDWK